MHYEDIQIYRLVTVCWPAISTYTIVLYGLHGINLLSCFCSVFELLIYEYI